MRMARVNVYVPDDLADEARQADLNVSALTQDAIREALGAQRVDQWLEKITNRKPSGISHRTAQGALRAAKDELEGLDA